MVKMNQKPSVDQTLKSVPQVLTSDTIVPLFKVRRNFAALTGNDPVCDAPVTAICPSKRPWFAVRVAQMLKAQTHENLHVIYVAHGPGHNLEALQRCFAGLKSVTVLLLPDADAPLGEALNLALDHCKTDLVTKIDDDDFYGPNYIRSAIAAFHYNGFENVGITGKERAYCYVEEVDTLALRYGRSHENHLRPRVFGGTIFWSRNILGDQRFIASNTGEDSAFFKDALEKGIQIFSAESSDYLHLRYTNKGEHTWQIDSHEFLRPATKISSGLRLYFVYSSAMPVGHTTIPSRQRKAAEIGFLSRLKKLIEREDNDAKDRQYRSLLMSKKHTKHVVPLLVPGLRSPQTYGQFSDIHSFTPPNTKKFVIKPASGSHSYGVYCLERISSDLFRDMTTGKEYSLKSLRHQYEAELIRVEGKMTKSCFTEEYIPADPGYSRPHDFKAYCFSGRVGLIMQKVFVTENKKDWKFKFWSPDWQDLGAIKYPDRVDPNLAAPRLGDQAVQLIADLSAKITRPFARIDVYITESEVVFSEITPKPNGGIDYFIDEWDQRLGEIWAECSLKAGTISRKWIACGG